VHLREEGARLGKHLAMLEALREVRRRVSYWTSGADLTARCMASLFEAFQS